MPQIQRDVSVAAVQTRREIDEGIAVAHFSPAGARLTGNDPIVGAPTAVIAGDSYVVARDVADRETMGAQLEQLARTAGTPLNVRQYGWSGASPAQYLLSSAPLLARWPISEVVIPLSDNDFDFNALVMASPRVRVLPDHKLRIIGESASLSPEPDHHFALVELARHRWYDFRLRAPKWVRPRGAPSAAPAGTNDELPPDSAELAAVPLAVVRALSQRYGRHLTLVYLADVRLVGDDTISEIERRFLDACRSENVPCASTRDAMLEMRGTGRITRGTSTNALGNGHLNAIGHAVVASVIWSLLRPRLAHAEQTPTK